MGNLGDFQQGVGEMSGTIGLVWSYIIGGIFFIIAIVFGVFAFIKTRNGTGMYCNTDSDCKFNDEKCIDGKCFQTKETRKPVLLLFSLLFILVGIGYIWFSRVYNKWVHKSRTNAQIAGTFTEFNIAANMLYRN